MTENKVSGLFAGGLGYGFASLEEADFAAGAGAAYAPPERGQWRRNDVARTIQLLAQGPGVILTVQSSEAHIRLPSGLTATNDAGAGRCFFIQNGGAGVIRIRDHLGVILRTLGPNSSSLIFHTNNNGWITTATLGGAMAPTAPTQVTVAVTAAATNYDLLQAGSVTPPAANAPEDHNGTWTPDGFAKIHVEVDLSAMLAGDDATILIEKQVDGATWDQLESLPLAGVQSSSHKFEIHCNTGYPMRCGISRAGGAAYNAEVLYWAEGGTP